MAGGAPQDFTAFVAAATPRLLGAAKLLDPSHAEDLVQDTLVRVAAQWGRLDDPAPYAYARTVLYHLAVDGWRRAWRRRERSTGELPEAAAPYDAALVPDRLALRTALAALPPRQRAVIVLRYYEDLGEAETAAALGCSVNTVKSHHRAALANLRRLAPTLLAEEPYDERGGEQSARTAYLSGTPRRTR